MATTKRQIWGLYLVEAVARNYARMLRVHKRGVRVHTRRVRVENLPLWVYVVVAGEPNRGGPVVSDEDLRQFIEKDIALNAASPIGCWRCDQGFEHEPSVCGRS